jgi:hypothetical protein
LLRDGANLALGSEDILKPYQSVYSQSLRQELLPKAREQSTVDLHYLERLGVIELTQTNRQAPREELRAVAPEEKVTARKTRTTKSEKAKDAPVLQSSKQEAENSDKPQSESTSKQPPSDALLSSMTPVQLAVLEAIPDDRAVSGDFISGLDFSKDVVTWENVKKDKDYYALNWGDKGKKLVEETPGENVVIEDGMIYVTVDFSAIEKYIDANGNILIAMATNTSGLKIASMENTEFAIPAVKVTYTK